MYLLHHRTGKVVTGDKASELVSQLDVRLVDRVLFVEGARYHSYSDEFSPEELASEVARDGVRALCRNHGWKLYKEA